MMWGVLLAVLAVLALLGRTRLGIRGVYTMQEAGLWLRAGPVQLRLYPRREKNRKPKGERPPEKPSGEGERSAPFLSPGGMFRLARRLLPVALEGAGDFRRRLQVEVLQADILVGGPDPAAAAARYGQINALLGAVWQPLSQALHIRDGRVHVEADFDRPAPQLYGRVSLSLTASQLLWLGLKYGPRCLNILLDVRKQETAASGRQRKAA